VTSRSHQAALVAGQHAPKDRRPTLLRLRMCTAKADQSFRTMLSGGQSAEVRAHVAQVAARGEGRPFLCSLVLQTVLTVIGVIETAHGLAILLDELTGVELGVDHHGVRRGVPEKPLNNVHGRVVVEPFAAWMDRPARIDERYGV
jgi:hypothetical protein